MKKISRLLGLFERGSNTCFSLSNVFLWIAVLVLASTILTGSSSVVAAVGIAAATANYAHGRHLNHSAHAVEQARSEIQSRTDTRITEALTKLDTWRIEIETRVREAVQTSEVAAKLRMQRSPGTPR